MAESVESKSFSFDDEDDEWNQSKIKGNIKSPKAFGDF